MRERRPASFIVVPSRCRLRALLAGLLRDHLYSQHPFSDLHFASPPPQGNNAQVSCTACWGTSTPTPVSHLLDSPLQLQGDSTSVLFCLLGHLYSNARSELTQLGEAVGLRPPQPAGLDALEAATSGG